MDQQALLTAIDQRISRRTYQAKALSDDDARRLREVIDEYAQPLGGGRMELVVGDPRAFGGLTASYGLFSGVENFIVLVSTTGDEDSTEKLGYYGELVSLAATQLGLGTCFVGGTFDKARIPVKLRAGERVSAVIAVGYVDGNPKGKEKMVRDVLHRKTKSVQEMSEGFGTPPPWFTDGVRAAQKAPSAMNRQPAVFRFDSPVISAAVDNAKEWSQLMDLGIAKAHFAIGAGGGYWEWGNHGQFVRTEGMLA